jgi:hypothetical protein
MKRMKRMIGMIATYLLKGNGGQMRHSASKLPPPLAKTPISKNKPTKD